MCNKIFNIGDKVRVTQKSANASQFTSLLKKVDLRGVYAIPNWEQQIFTIASNPKLTGFTHLAAPTAYALRFKSKVIGYVYTNAIKINQ